MRGLVLLREHDLLGHSDHRGLRAYGLLILQAARHSVWKSADTGPHEPEGAKGVRRSGSESEGRRPGTTEKYRPERLRTEGEHEAGGAKPGSRS